MSEKYLGNESNKIHVEWTEFIKRVDKSNTTKYRFLFHDNGTNVGDIKVQY